MKLAKALAVRRTPAAGEHARVTGGWEIIGPDECPLFGRRTLLSVGRWGKLLWHQFLPNATDKDCHDHPRSFLTIVLRGGYDDESRCAPCFGAGTDILVTSIKGAPCPYCHGTGRIIDHLQAPTVRFRRASHAHITKVGPSGATTLVVMGPLRREWGFWREGQWWAWRIYERRFGLNWRCEG